MERFAATRHNSLIVSNGHRALTAERLPLKSAHSRLVSQRGEYDNAFLRNLEIATSLHLEQKKSSRIRAYFSDQSNGH